MKTAIYRVDICRSCQLRLAKQLAPQFPARSARSASRRLYSSRPSIAPKPILDIKHIRQNPGLYEQNCVDRNYNALSKHPWRIIELFEQWQGLQRTAREHRERANALRHKLAHPRSRSDDGKDGVAAEDDNAVMSEARKVKSKLSAFEEQEKALQDEMEHLAWELPNLSSRHSPTGSEPEVIGYINEHPEPKASPTDRVWRSHVHIGSELGLIDFAGAATTSGWGWYYLTNEAALLEQALVQYALSVGIRRGWTPVSPPSITYSHIASACGFQPRDHNGEQQVFSLEQPERNASKPSHVLAGTAEIPLAGMKANQTLEEGDVPLRVMGASRCYRAEAGARGVDTKGLYRVHEFTKVEMFAWTAPERRASEDNFAAPLTVSSPSEVVFDEMMAVQTEILQALGLHCRMLEMPTTDLGASAVRKRDIEAFFPSRREKDDGWGEVTSTSMCTDYQSRRLGTRLRIGAGQKRYEWPETVNGTALAVPRVLAAILENGWDEKDMSVRVPEVLRPWIGGRDVIRRKH